jgi:predicted DNA-binding transcriptional regulator YafY
MTTDTPARLLQLLSLLQTPREWPGGELAERLGVSRRTVRRDVDRLRELGYPVRASMGAEGGYRLVAGTAMPPLVLDDEEAVAIAVGLRAGAGHAVEGVDEASVRALAKLEQVLPSRLSHRVATLQAATTALTSGDGAVIAPETLTVLASAVAGRERLRFGYRARDGAETRRVVEPYRLVSTGRRWYLVAYDLDREDWRTFRVDRVAAPFPTGGARFAPRELPTGDAAEYLRRSVYGTGTAPGGPPADGRPRADGRRTADRPREGYVFTVVFDAPAEVVAARVPGALGKVEPLTEDGAPGGGVRCRLRGTTDTGLEWLAVRLAMLGPDFTVERPAELIDCVREMGRRLIKAGAAGGARGSIEARGSIGDRESDGDRESGGT